jgi:hypothetical protein
MEQADEQALVERARRGEFDAFERLVTLHEDGACSAAMHVTPERNDMPRTSCRAPF